MRRKVRRLQATWTPKKNKPKVRFPTKFQEILRKIVALRWIGCCSGSKGWSSNACGLEVSKEEGEGEKVCVALSARKRFRHRSKSDHCYFPSQRPRGHLRRLLARWLGRKSSCQLHPPSSEIWRATSVVVMTNPSLPAPHHEWRCRCFR